jgi:AbrB family looped-hinge helix DNA binding protein
MHANALKTGSPAKTSPMPFKWYAHGMRVAIDGAGRVVVPKPLRDQLGISPETPLEIELVDGHLELSVPERPACVSGGETCGGYERRAADALLDR